MISLVRSQSYLIPPNSSGWGGWQNQCNLYYKNESSVMCQLDYLYFLTFWGNVAQRWNTSPLHCFEASILTLFLCAKWNKGYLVLLAHKTWWKNPHNKNNIYWNLVQIQRKERWSLCRMSLEFWLQVNLLYILTDYAVGTFFQLAQAIWKLSQKPCLLSRLK